MPSLKGRGQTGNAVLGIELLLDMVFTLAECKRTGEIYVTILDPDSWVTLLKQAPQNVRLIKMVVASEVQFPPELVVASLECLSLGKEFQVVDTLWHIDPNQLIPQMKKGSIDAIVRARHLPCLITLSGAEAGPGLIHRGSPGLFIELLEGLESSDP